MVYGCGPLSPAAVAGAAVLSIVYASRAGTIGQGLVLGLGLGEGTGARAGAGAGAEDEVGSGQELRLISVSGRRHSCCS